MEKSNFIYYLFFFGYIDLSKNKSKKNKIAVNFLEGCNYEKKMISFGLITNNLTLVKWLPMLSTQTILKNLVPKENK